MTSQCKRKDETANKKKRKVVFSQSFAYYQKQHESYKDRSTICKDASATTGHQITLLERVILYAWKYAPPKIACHEKKERRQTCKESYGRHLKRRWMKSTINYRHHREQRSLEHWHLICKFLLCWDVLPPFDVCRQVQTRDQNWESPLSPLSQVFFLSKQQLGALTISLLHLFRGEKKKKNR